MHARFRFSFDRARTNAFAHRPPAAPACPKNGPNIFLKPVPPGRAKFARPGPEKCAAPIAPWRGGDRPHFSGPLAPKDASGASPGSHCLVGPRALHTRHSFQAWRRGLAAGRRRGRPPAGGRRRRHGGLPLLRRVPPGPFARPPRRHSARAVRLRHRRLPRHLLLQGSPRCALGGPAAGRTHTALRLSSCARPAAPEPFENWKGTSTPSPREDRWPLGDGACSGCWPSGASSRTRAAF